MGVIFDIDGTLADATHRLHFIKDLAFFVPGGVTRDMKPDWETFLSDEQVSKDTAISATWQVLEALVANLHRVIFVTGRAERTRLMTQEWLMPRSCFLRTDAMEMLLLNQKSKTAFPLYMRTDGDHRPSSIVKQEGLMRARADGYDPVMVFEDRKDDTEMWRRNGLLCCQVAEGNY